MVKSAAVEAWFADSDHPLKDVMLRVREIILNSDPRMEESIKWQSPTFEFQGNLVSFNPRSKAHVSLMFHTGALIPGNHQRLEGGANAARYMRIANLEDAEKCKDDLQAIVNAWCKWKAGTEEA